jgi:hypothetical protein
MKCGGHRQGTGRQGEPPRHRPRPHGNPPTQQQTPRWRIPQVHHAPGPATRPAHSTQTPPEAHRPGWRFSIRRSHRPAWRWSPTPDRSRAEIHPRSAVHAGREAPGFGCVVDEGDVALEDGSGIESEKASEAGSAAMATQSKGERARPAGLNAFPKSAWLAEDGHYSSTDSFPATVPRLARHAHSGMACHGAASGFLNTGPPPPDPESPHQ